MWFSFNTVVFLLFLASAQSSDEDLKKIDSIVQEDPCRRAGGICTVAEDCPEGHLSEKSGLCPIQLQYGIECCYGVSKKETRCVKHGGVCMSLDTTCNPRLVFNASDCSETSRCCIMTL